jgi:16S rRNA (cytosine967-C5)-methyltransferase
MTDDTKAHDHRLSRQLLSATRLRGQLIELWQRTRMDWGFVTDELAVTFRKQRWLGSSERRFLSEALYGMVRHARRVDAALAAAGRASPRDTERVIAYLLLEGLLGGEEAAQVHPELRWSAVLGFDRALADERDPLKRVAVAHSLPDWLAQRLLDDWGDDAGKMAAGLNQRAPMTVRANLLKGDRPTLMAHLAEEGLRTHPGVVAPTAVVVDSRTNLFSTRAFQAGEMEAQDEGSQLLAELATPRDLRGIVVDLCAGAGGKTLAIAAAMHSKGRILATDIDGRKLEELRRRARRAGASNIQAMDLGDRRPVDVLATVKGKVDVVFVDAPCSGTGALRRNPESRWRLRPDDVTALIRQQSAILDGALELVAPGGVLIYATCSVLRSENQGVVDAFLSRHPAFRVTPLTSLWGERASRLGDGTYLQVAPHLHGTDGFFAAVLTRVPR